MELLALCLIDTGKANLFSPGRLKQGQNEHLGKRMLGRRSSGALVLITKVEDVLGDLTG